MPFVSSFAQRRKIDFFLPLVPRDATVLEIGSGSSWLKDHMLSNGWTGYVGLDIVPPADIVGDILQWQKIGLKAESFDAIIAFEVVEHVDCFQACWDLLKPGGCLLATSPVPERDWVMKILENLGLNQKRTSPHDHLVHFKTVNRFPDKHVKIIGGLSQWGVFRKTMGASASNRNGSLATACAAR